MSFLKHQIAARLRSFVVAVAVLHQQVLGVPQVTASADIHASALPDLNGPSSSAPASCGGCYIVADVAGLVWYSEIFINTGATAVVNVGVGNGSRVTSTSLIANEVQFTFNLSMATAMGSPPLALTQVHYDSTVTVAGAILTSPTPYNVFSAYSITSAYSSNGACVTTSGTPFILPSAFTQTLPSADGQVTLDAAGEQSFINFLGFSSCSGGGEVIIPTALVQVKNITTTTTTTRSSVSLAAAMSLAPQTTIPSATAASVSLTTLTSILTTLTAKLPSTTFTSTFISSSTSTISSTTSYASVTNAPKFVYGSGSSTITLAANPVALPYIPGNLTLTGNGTTIVLPTGSGGYTGSLTPFIGGASRIQESYAWTYLWIVGIASLLCFIGVL